MPRLSFLILSVLALKNRADSDTHFDNVLSASPLIKAFTSVFSLTMAEMRHFKNTMSKVSALGVEDEEEFDVIFSRLLEERPSQYKKLEWYQETNSNLSKLSRKFLNQVFLECLHLVGTTTSSDLKNAEKMAIIRLRKKFSILGRTAKGELRLEVPELVALLQ